MERCGISDEAILKINPLNMEFHEADIEHIKGLYLKEYSNYEIIIKSKNNANVEFYHENINIRNKITPITSKVKEFKWFNKFQRRYWFC